MRSFFGTTVAALALTLASTVAIAQSSSPYTRLESQVLSEIWETIRTAERYEDISWSSVGLTGPPGSLEAQRITSVHWADLRGAESFVDIDWKATTGFAAESG